MNLEFKIQKHPSRRVFLGKGVLKIFIKYTGKHPCWSVISIKLLCNYTSAWVFSCKFSAYFQNTFSYKSTSGEMFVKITSGEIFQGILVSLERCLFEDIYNRKGTIFFNIIVSLLEGDWGNKRFFHWQKVFLSGMENRKFRSQKRHKNDWV